jgi:hypothetical protein
MRMTNATDYTLRLRQRDVKNATWMISLNGQKLGALIEDERRMVQMLAVPAGVLQAGSNTLRIECEKPRFSDDIEVRDIRLEPLSRSEYLRQATVNVRVAEAGQPLPVRITVVDRQGWLVPFAALRAGAREAVRTGVVYTADGSTRIGLPKGRYRVYASRGFEYSAPSTSIALRTGDTRSLTFDVRREASMTGYISADTHVHTRELSGHGDATVAERVLTAAGEGLDLIVATEHNRVADYSTAIGEAGLQRWVLSVPGSEVTTPLGHFNVFPLGPHPDAKEADWTKLMDSLHGGGGRVVIQNHPRDVHLGYRPFDPAHHVSATGENLIGRPFRANAVEVVNSGAMHSDPLQLVRDWMGLLSRGLAVAAIGASDTHTVDFVPIGQARTYIEVPRPDVVTAVRQLAAGRNVVSYGLAADLELAGEVRGGIVPVRVKVTGPSWSAADRVTVYADGVQVWQRAIRTGKRAGLKLNEVLQLPAGKSLVAVATGPGVMEPFWEVRKPYQPMSDEWRPMVLGISRALFVGQPSAEAKHALGRAQERNIVRPSGFLIMRAARE